MSHHKRNRITPSSDIAFMGSLGIYVVAGLSDQGARWLQENLLVESWQGTARDGIVVDGGQYAMAIADGAVGEGLRVEVNGVEYRAVLDC